MIQVNTILDVVDNSGAKKAKCIRILTGYKRKTAKVGDTIVISVQSARSAGKVQKGEVHKAVVVRTKKSWERSSGFGLSFSENAVVLMGGPEKPLGSRLSGPVTHELRKRNHSKLFALAASAAI